MAGKLARIAGPAGQPVVCWAGPSGPQVVCRASGPASVFMRAGLCGRARVRAFGVRGCVRAFEWMREWVVSACELVRARELVRAFVRRLGAACSTHHSCNYDANCPHSSRLKVSCGKEIPLLPRVISWPFICSSATADFKLRLEASRNI